LLNLGVHVSAAGKVCYVFDRAKRLGCTTFQFFASNPRQWRKGPLADEDIAEFNAKRKALGIKPIVIHIPYTLNLAAAKESFYAITLREFADALLEANDLGAEYLVTHPGSYKKISHDEGLKKVINGLMNIFDNTKNCKTKVLLENTAGSGCWLGSEFAELKAIIDGVSRPDRLAVCLDTAHAWAAGYKIDTPAGVDVMLDEIAHTIGIDTVRVVHLNDNPKNLGAKKDQHAHIGKGKIGLSGVRALVNHEKMRHAAFILETPKENEDDDMINLQTVRKLYKE